MTTVGTASVEPDRILPIIDKVVSKIITDAVSASVQMFGEIALVEDGITLTASGPLRALFNEADIAARDKLRDAYGLIDMLEPVIIWGAHPRTAVATVAGIVVDIINSTNFAAQPYNEEYMCQLSESILQYIEKNINSIAAKLYSPEPISMGEFRLDYTAGSQSK